MMGLLRRTQPTSIRSHPCLELYGITPARGSHGEAEEGMRLAALLQYGQCHIADLHARFRLRSKRSVMRVTVQHQVRLVTAQRLLQPRTAKKRKQRLRFAKHRLQNRRVMRHSNLYRRV